MIQFEIVVCKIAIILSVTQYVEEVLQHDKPFDRKTSEIH